MISKQSNTQPALSNSVLPNFVKTVLFAAAAATSVSTFAGDHEAGEKIGELKDMKKKEVMLKGDDMNSSLKMPKSENLADIQDDGNKLLDDAADELKAKASGE